MANYCEKCGKPVNPGDTFCNNCGHQLGGNKDTQTYDSYYTQPRYRQPKLYRSVDDRWIAGVCGGLGKHFNIDPILIRIGFILAGIGGAGLILYIVLAIFIEEEPLNPEHSASRIGKSGY